MSLTFALSALLWGQSSPPPYLDYIAEVRQIARATVATAICAEIGYDVVEDGMLIEGRAFRRRAIAAGTDGWVLDAAYSEELEAEQDRFVTMMTPPSEEMSDAERDAFVDSASAYWEGRCHSARMAYPNVFSLNPD